MAHVMKHTKASCGHMFAHYDRNATNISNESLDESRTHLNYNLADHQQMDQGEFVKQRCSEVRCQNRKDVNVMCSWVLTAPKDLSAEEHKAFFEKSYEFLSNRYGKDNVVSAYVHMDEVQPHMHFAFVPVTYDQKHDRFKVSAKEVVNRTDLQTFHEDLSGYLKKTLGHEVGVLNEATKEGNKSIQELKRETATETLNKTLEEVSRATERKQALESQIKDLEGKVLTLQEVNQIKISKPILGNEKSIIKMPYKDAIALQNTAKRIEKVESMFEEFKKEKALFEKEKKIPMAEKIENAKNKEQLQRYLKVLDMNPQLKALFEVAKVATKSISQDHDHEI